jgi:ribonuclease HII
MRVMGIDEAGRGCVLGPLVIGAFWCDGDDPESLLREAGANDSKKLSPKRRVAIRDRLTALGNPAIRAVEPVEIDNGNLNHLEEAVIMDLVREVQPDLVIIDALGHPKTLGAVVERLRAGSGSPRTTWKMEPKADSTYAVVGAASIFAKTLRDQRLADDTAAYGDLGSGYPSDPLTRAWIDQWARKKEPWPAFVRTRWETIETISQQALF